MSLEGEMIIDVPNAFIGHHFVPLSFVITLNQIRIMRNYNWCSDIYIKLKFNVENVWMFDED